MDGGGRCAMTAGVLWMRTSPAESSVGHVRHIGMACTCDDVLS